MSEHTPGPWEIVRRESGGRVYRIEIHADINGGRGYKPVAQIPSGFANQEEDARLIAAAPTMLGILRGLVAELDSYEIDDIMLAEPLRLARAVIAQIDGGTPCKPGT